MLLRAKLNSPSSESRVTGHTGFAEELFIITSLILFSGGPIKLISLGGISSQDFQEGNNPVEQLIFLAIHSTALSILVARRQVLDSLLSSRYRLIMMPMLALLGVIAASALWSNFPDVTVRRGIALIGTTIFGLYLVTQRDLKHQLILLSKTFGCIIGLSFVFAIALPNYGQMGDIHIGAWRGIYIHKNALGSVMTLSSLLFIVQILSNRRRNLIPYCAGLIGSLILLLFSSSKSALLNLLVLIVISILYTALKWSYEVMFPFISGMFLLVVSIGIFLAENFVTLLELMGKDPTLTGRTDLWPYVLDAIAKQPLLGYGYEGFWQGLDSDAAMVWYAVGWKPTHPHNGLVQLLLIFGIVGTVIYLFIFIVGYVKSLSLLRISGNVEYLWPSLFLTYTFMTNISETQVLEYNDISWVLYTMSVLCVFQYSKLKTIRESQ
jgi:O-antigen ligase